MKFRNVSYNTRTYYLYSLELLHVAACESRENFLMERNRTVLRCFIKFPH